jgi:hypothetical protein
MIVVMSVLHVIILQSLQILSLSSLQVMTEDVEAVYLREQLRELEEESLGDTGAGSGPPSDAAKKDDLQARLQDYLDRTRARTDSTGSGMSVRSSTGTDTSCLTLTGANNSNDGSPVLTIRLQQ